ncbi:MAG: cytochrome C oxidase subunit IV family protein [Planctomycetota bacterium]
MSHDSHSHGDHKPHALPIPILVGTWLALMALTGLTVWVADQHLGKIDFVISMAIATVKATLVALIFMHLLWDKGFHSILVVGGVLLLGLFMAVTMFDREHYQDSMDQYAVDHQLNRRYPVIEHTDEGHGGGEEHAPAPEGEAPAGH